MKRSRTGCQICRSRRIKCDEARPQCLNCVKKELHCSYEIRFQWMFQTFPNLEDSNSSTINGQPVKPNSLSARAGPRSRKRKIGQEVVGFQFRNPLRTRPPTMMIETPFESDDDPVTLDEVNDGQSLGLFRKFRIVNRSVHEEPRTKANPSSISRLPSPLVFPIERSYPESVLPSLASSQIAPSALQLEPSQVYKESYLDNRPPITLMSEQELMDHFVNVTADELVPIPYEENPFLRLLPHMAQTDLAVHEVLVAYAATHKSNILYGVDMIPAVSSFVADLVMRSARRLNAMQQKSPNTDRALLIATMLALIEIDRGYPDHWYHFMSVALDIVRSRPTFAAWDLSVEINSMTFRLLGYMCGIGSLWLAYGSEDLLSFPSWPEWTGSLDYLTGIDLNLLPLFSEASRLIRIRKREKLGLRELAVVNSQGLRIIQRLNDYWLEEYWPDSDITAMCIMFQESLQLHVLRRVIGFPTSHHEVQRIVRLMMDHVEQWISVSSTMHRCMTFILATMASEAQVPQHRMALLLRLQHMAEAGFAYNYKVCEDIRKHWDMNTSLIVSHESTLVV